MEIISHVLMDAYVLIVLIENIVGLFVDIVVNKVNNVVRFNNVIMVIYVIEIIISQNIKDLVLKEKIFHYMVVVRIIYVSINNIFVIEVSYIRYRDSVYL